MAYDLIGDIHGHADKLEALLHHLGYRVRDGAYRHPSRTAVFVGDLIDTGPRQVDCVQTVRRMVDAGSALAILGNHEFNAIAWHTPDPVLPGEYLRPHAGDVGAKNREQHEAFLASVEQHPALHKELIDWFLTLPLWLDLPELKVVHACWHEEHMRSLAPLLTHGRQLRPEGVVAASRRGSVAYRALETLAKGIEVPLPDGHVFHDKNGHARDNVRIRWWGEGPETFRARALMPEEPRARLPDQPLPGGILPPPADDRPVFFGHYWMQGRPAPQSSRAVCLDYSAAKGGDLVAYRWDGEPLSPAQFAWVG